MSARDDARAALDAWDDAVSDWAGHAQALAEALQAVLDEPGEPERAQGQQTLHDIGWAAEQEPDDAERTAIRGMWYPYIQLQGSMGVDLDIHFPTEQDCLEFIRDEVLGVRFFPGVEPAPARAQSQDRPQGDGLRDAPFGPLTTAAWRNAHTPGPEAHHGD